MKFYCHNCGSVFETSPRVHIFEDKLPNYYCPECNRGMNRIPSYETPGHYKSRTGKEYPDNGQTWIIFENHKEWTALSYAGAKNSSPHFKPVIVIADPSIPPSGSWRPEDEKEDETIKGFKPGSY